MRIQESNTPSGPCVLSRDGDWYVMRGPSGQHRLHAGSTDKSRLESHWAGFLEVNGGEVAHEPVDVQVWDQIRNRPTFWEPEGRWLRRWYFDPNLQRVALVSVCMRKNKTARDISFYSLKEEGMSFKEFRQKWTPVVDGCRWKRRAPITQAHLQVMHEASEYQRTIGQLTARSHQFVSSLSRRGLKLHGESLLGVYTPGERQSYGCHCEDSRCTSEGHWEEPAYFAGDSPLVRWLLDGWQDD